MNHPHHLSPAVGDTACWCTHTPCCPIAHAAHFPPPHPFGSLPGAPAGYPRHPNDFPPLPTYSSPPPPVNSFPPPPPPPPPPAPSTAPGPQLAPNPAPARESALYDPRASSPFYPHSTEGLMDGSPNDFTAGSPSGSSSDDGYSPEPIWRNLEAMIQARRKKSWGTLAREEWESNKW